MPKQEHRALPSGRPSQKPSQTSPLQQVLISYLYEGNRVIGETDAAGAVVAHYVYVNRANVPDFMVRLVNGVWETYRLLSDQAGSPKMLVRLTNGPAVVERYDWDDWGVPTSTWPAAFHPFAFAGGLWDASVGLSRFGARDYRPWEGRWWSKDPSGFAGGVNLYAYAESRASRSITWPFWGTRSRRSPARRPPLPSPASSS